MRDSEGWRRRARSFAGFALLLSPLAAINAAFAAAEQHAEAWGRLLGATYGPGSGESAPPVIVRRAPHAELLAPDVQVTDGQATAPSRRHGTSRKPISKSTAPRATDFAGGLRVSQQSILRLAQNRAVPDAVAVPATATHPAGLRLSGVAGLGVGMQEGDVLATVAGTPVTSRADVVGLVLSARSRQAPAVNATFWRRGHQYQLTVEMPYPDVAPADLPR